jgi:hypothetical protein
VTKIDLLTVVSRFLSDLRSHMQATTINLALMLKSPVRKDSQLRPFQIVETSFALCVIHTTMMVLVASSYKNDVGDSLLTTSNRPNMLFNSVILVMTI